MKRTIITTMALTVSLAFATIRTVDNHPNQAGADHINLQEAHEAASNGDTILVSPSHIPYPGIEVTKLLYFFGVGFDLEDLSDISSNMMQTAIISGTMQFQSNSEGSLIEGFDGDFFIDVYVSNLVIRKNKLDRIYINSNSIKAKKHSVCLDFHIGRCDGPCEGLVNTDKYISHNNQKSTGLHLGN